MFKKTILSIMLLCTVNPAITAEEAQQVKDTRTYYDLNVSFYCPYTCCCGDYADGYTASGTIATQGRTCAAPAEIPFGTVIHIDGLGDYIVEDRGGAIIKNGNTYCIDIYMDSHEEALKMGRIYTKGYIDNED